jgi:hypothetical protein
VQNALLVGERLTGLSLEQLGFEPRVEELTPEQLDERPRTTGSSHSTAPPFHDSRAKAVTHWIMHIRRHRPKIRKWRNSGQIALAEVP